MKRRNFFKWICSIPFVPSALSALVPKADDKSIARSELAKSVECVSFDTPQDDFRIVIENELARIKRTIYYWMPPNIDAGGYLEIPNISEWYLPKEFIDGKTWHRLSDELQYTRTWFALTQTWMGFKK